MSLLSDIAVPVAKLVNAKRGNEKAMENPRRDTDFFNRNNFDKSFQTDEEFIDGFQVITVKTEKSLNRHVIFLHGGGYVLRAVRSHKNIVERMDVEIKDDVVIIILHAKDGAPYESAD